MEHPKCTNRILAGKTKGGIKIYYLFDSLLTIEFFTVSTKMTDLKFLLMLYIWTNVSMLNYVKMLSYAKDLIPEMFREHLNNSELQILNQLLSIHAIFL